MKTFEQYKNIDDKTKEIENIFLKISHFNELEIKFDLLHFDLGLFYFYKDECFIEIDRYRYEIWINYEKIWTIIDNEISVVIRTYMQKIMDKYFGIGYNVDWSNFEGIENYFGSEI